MFEPDFENTSFAQIKVIGVGGRLQPPSIEMVQYGLRASILLRLIRLNRRCIWQRRRRRSRSAKIDQGLGAGADPDVGRKAADESRETITEALQARIWRSSPPAWAAVTGTGATSIVAECARELGILTIAVVTKPLRSRARCACATPKSVLPRSSRPWIRSLRSQTIN